MNFPAALRLVQAGHRARRAGWDPSQLYAAWDTNIGRVELVREGSDDKGRFRFTEPYVGGGALGGPPIEDLLAEDWHVVEDRREPSVDGGERAQAAQLAEIADEEQRAAGASA